MVTISAKLTSQSLKEAAKELLDYQNNVLKAKLRQFREVLASKGIIAARASASGGLGQYITFSMTSDDDSTIIVAKETTQLLSEWLRGEEVISVNVSPLLMAEFGAGQFAVNWEDSDGTQHDVLSDGTRIGRGSFPDQTHAFEDSWWYMDLGKNWHRVRGTVPTRPMHNAVIEIITQIENTAREVFGNGG